jgi:hypothetical protein
VAPLLDAVDPSGEGASVSPAIARRVADGPLRRHISRYDQFLQMKLPSVNLASSSRE